MTAKKSPMKVVGYVRVSTKRQGESGLGLEAQRLAVETYGNGSGTRVIAMYTEVESGKRADRPELHKAIAHARRSKATFVVAKMDRLARNVAFLAALMDAGADFVACDNPHANRLTVHILAAVAEDEARRISVRTKAALGAAKRRGVKLGSARPGHWADPERRAARVRGLPAGRERSIDVRRKAARDAYADLSPDVTGWRKDGLSLGKIAARLNEQGHTTRRGSAWTANAVRRVLALAITA